MAKNKPREVCETALDLIKVSEGFEPQWYKCSASKWTIGYGTRGAPTPDQIKNEKISKKEATALMMDHVRLRASDPIERLVNVKLNDNQFGALVSLVYNIGSGNFHRSTLLKMLNKSDYEGAADQFQWWRKANGVILDGLVTRRQNEKELFLS